MVAEYLPEIIDRICKQLAEGKSLSTICKQKGMPNRATVQRWLRADDELGERVRDAREVGFADLAERTLVDVEKCRDPIKARVLLDARRWYLGKLSNAFAEKPVAIGVQVNVGADDAFAAIAGALEDAAAARASLAHSTSAVVVEGETRPADAGGRVACLAGPGGAGVGKDPDGS